MRNKEYLTYCSKAQKLSSERDYFVTNCPALPNCGSERNTNIMRNTCKIVASLLLLAAISFLAAVPAQAQLILAEGTYRVTELNQDKERIGIAKLSANPTVTQNWVYLKLKTKITKRFSQNGWLRDENVAVDQVFNIIEVGDVIQVKGGRDWNGSISAKDILIMPDNIEE